MIRLANISPSLTTNKQSTRVHHPHQLENVSLESHLVRCTPQQISDRLQRIANLPSPEVQQPNFRFEVSESAATHNINYLQIFAFDLQAALESDKHSFTSAGSEFLLVTVLEPLLQHHPLWHRLKLHLLNGIEFSLQPLSTQSRRRDLLDALQFGPQGGVEIPKIL